MNEALKQAAAERAVGEIRDGMVVGLGTGSTAEIAVELLGARVAKGLKIRGVPTSERTASLAGRLGIPLIAAQDEWPAIDLAVDGADQVERGTLNLVKGLGGALLREKIVARASARFVVVVDDSKLVDRLGGATPLPVEILPFGQSATLRQLERLGLQPRLRLAAGIPFLTDGGHHIADCGFAGIADVARLETELSATVGVVETGLFLGLAAMVVVGRPDGVEVMVR
ncbi:MAG TPA: ribose-5-phosphate isomerase RpiA [Reyranella sp.]|nr:ribose-5-phosphate isomerase RpiA [Reyranella sp.]